MSDNGETEKNPRLIVLEDGSEVIVNLNLIKWQEAREALFGADYDKSDPEKTRQGEQRYAELIGKTVGKSAKEMLALGFEDFRAISNKFVELIRNPIKTDPN